MARSTLKVAAVQMCSGRDPEQNLRQAETWVRRAADEGAGLVALPENFAFLGDDADKLPWAQDAIQGAFIEAVRAWARECSVWVLAGSIPEVSPDSQRTYNTAVLVDRQGQVVSTYRKIHLFDIDLADQVTLRESASVAPGADPVVAEVEGWRLGLSICYDLRFPELYRALVAQGADILAVPAAFTLQTGKDHWDVLLRSRAIENQCFVVAPAQFGHHFGRRYSWGKTQIVDPWGTVLGCAPEAPSMVIASLDPERQDQIRQQLPCLQHRRMS